MSRYFYRKKKKKYRLRKWFYDYNEAMWLRSSSGWHIYRDHNVAWYHAILTAAVWECLYLLWKKLGEMAESTSDLIRERGGFDIYEDWIFFMLPPVETGHQLLAISSSHFPISPLSQSVNINRSKIMLAKCQFHSVKSFASPFSKPLPSFCTNIPSFLSLSLLFIPFLYNSSICSDRKCLICN